jgi:hypothetical protein
MCARRQADFGLGGKGWGGGGGTPRDATRARAVPKQTCGPGTCYSSEGRCALAGHPRPGVNVGL